MNETAKEKIYREALKKITTDEFNADFATDLNDLLERYVQYSDLVDTIREEEYVKYFLNARNEFIAKYGFVKSENLLLNRKLDILIHDMTEISKIGCADDHEIAMRSLVLVDKYDEGNNG